MLALETAIKNLDARLTANELKFKTGDETISKNFSEMSETFDSHVLKLDDFVKKIESKFGEIQGEVTSLSVNVRGLENDTKTQEASLAKALAVEFEKHKTALTSVVSEANSQFAAIQSYMNDVKTQTATEFGAMSLKLANLEEQIQGNGGTHTHVHRGMIGYLPLKSSSPGQFDGKDGAWRKWQDKFADFVDMVNPGMRKFLKAVEGERGPLDNEWLKSMEKEYSTAVTQDGTKLYRALKALTDGEAHIVVQSVRAEDGFAAWKSLQQRYGLSVAARQGQAMNDVTAMTNPPAKTPAETRAKLIELDRRVKIAEEATGKELDQIFSKAVMTAFLDPTTRAHTSAYQGVDKTYQEARAAVLEFVGLNVISNHKPDSNSTAMDISMVTGGAQEEEWPAEPQEEQEEWQTLAAVKPTTVCHTCGGWGHVHWQCPTVVDNSTKGKGKDGKGKASGKGKGQSSGKGKRGGKGKGPTSGKGGPKGGCWQCGGPHYSNECPQQPAAKGKGKGLNSLEWPTLGEQQQQLPNLCNLTKAKVPKIQLHNRFAALGDTEKPQMELKTRPEDQMPQQEPLVMKLGSVAGKLCPLATIEPEQIAAVSEPQWESIEFAVDSGASETVISDNLLTCCPTRPSAASRRGVMYEVANGEQIPNLGEKHIKCITDGEGIGRAITAQVCDVSRPLMSVHKLVQAGNTVVFSPNGAYIEDAHGREYINLQEKGGMYMAKVWVPTNPESAGF